VRIMLLIRRKVKFIFDSQKSPRCFAMVRRTSIRIPGAQKISIEAGICEADFTVANAGRTCEIVAMCQQLTSQTVTSAFEGGGI
jgi:hypothetical protein